MRTLITQDPFIHLNKEKSWRELGNWPSAWVCCPDAGQPPFVTAYRLLFRIDQSARVRVHVAADERYDLYLDGRWIGRGNERGAPDLWFYETYDLPLSEGSHTLVARVWSLGDRAAQAQMSVHPGFLLAAEEKWVEVLNTGSAPWMAARLDGYEFLSPNPAHWRGARVRVDGASFKWGYEQGQGSGWQPVTVLQPAIGRLSDWEFHRQHLLRPATLPPLLNRCFTGPDFSGRVCLVSAVPSTDTKSIAVRQQDHLLEEAECWLVLLRGAGSVQVPPHTTRRVLIDLGNYYTAYPEMRVSGGAGSRVRVHWAESLYLQPKPIFGDKGSRAEVEGKYFIGFGDEFLPDGGTQRCFDTLWWMAGRYVEVLVQSADQPLDIDSFSLHETRYPLEMESQFKASDPRLAEVTPILIRGLQMCANETYFDCPYYEELQYAGDTRLEILVTYMMTRDDRLPRKALRMFDASRLASGLTQSRYPSRIMQIIPPFALWWVMIVRDYALWRNDLEFIRQLMPGVRATVDGFQCFMGPDGLLYSPEGWNTIDWVPAWDKDAGVPPDGHSGASGLLNWQLVYTLAQAADLEQRLGESRFAAEYRERAVRLAGCLVEAFFDEQRGLLADDLAHQCFSEHSQCMALLSDDLLGGLLDADMRQRLAENLLADPALDRATIYFSHYLFETYRLLSRVDALLERMSLWFGLQEQGLKTPIEMPEPTRSDCHAWGSHPLFHYFATILGIRPASLGFQEVEIKPQLGPLDSASGCLVHPGGEEIEVDFRRKNGRMVGSVRLPAGVTGRLVCDGQVIELVPGDITQIG